MAVKIKDLTIHPLVKAFICISIVYFALFSMIMSDHFDFKLKELVIESSMKKIVNENCPDSFISWAIYDQTPFSDQYIFDDVIGCINKTKAECAVSLKELNKFWQTSHSVDPDSYDFLNSFYGDEVKHYSNVEDLSKYGSIYKAIKSYNQAVANISLVVVKKHMLINGINSKVVYVFSLSHTKNAINVCKPNIIEQKLQELYRKASK